MMLVFALVGALLTDIFSLGIVIYEMLSGQRPFKGTTIVDVLHSIVNNPPRPLAHFNPRTPPRLQAILNRALSKDPAKATLYGTGGLGLLKAEFSDRPMSRGAVAAVLRPSSKDSAGNQFFICLSDQAALTGKFTIFGEVVEGMDVVDKIGETPVEGDRAQKRVEIQKISVK